MCACQHERDKRKNRGEGERKRGREKQGGEREEGGKGGRERGRGKGEREFPLLQLRRAACCVVVILFSLHFPKYWHSQENKSHRYFIYPYLQGILLQTKPGMNGRSGNAKGAFK